MVCDQTVPYIFRDYLKLLLFFFHQMSPIGGSTDKLNTTVHTSQTTPAALFHAKSHSLPHRGKMSLINSRYVYHGH